MKRTGYEADHNPLIDNTTAFGGYGRIAGIKIITRPALPELDAVPRGWIERLFTWPWRPLISSRLVLNKANVRANGMVHDVGGTMIMTPRVYESLKARLSPQARKPL